MEGEKTARMRKMGAETSRNKPVIELMNDTCVHLIMYTCIFRQPEKKDCIGMRIFKEL